MIMSTSEPKNSLYRSIIAVSNRHLCSRPLTVQTARVCECHPYAFLLREKDLTEPAYAKLAADILDICRSYRVPCILHTYPEAARILKCDSIHLPLDLLRKQYSDLGDFTVIGTSVHSVEEAQEAERLGATYITAGHIYTTDCKKGLPPRGTDFLRSVCSRVSIPVFAIGGIHPDPVQIREITDCGASGGCMMSEMMTL
ncbi:MAG: thiamine phosphate synthase [Candidatus Choladocola sp.]|nr:thiamine phosphate synthase [Candidatus Choladocola sp.]